MTEKRFKLIGNSNTEFIMQNELLLPIYDNDKQLTLKECYNLLNKLNDENKELKKELYNCEKVRYYIFEKMNELKGDIK